MFHSGCAGFEENNKRNKSEKTKFHVGMPKSLP